ncbi:hypothetical protein COL5a_005352 [Colletotrichum fioriniae]|uniref:nucleolar protein n=1 Tax=Colletotrichum fioriniae TaxID=710243 RepID=UPI0023008E8A|nr:uncharacterized protein COL516b_006109 [Colletotrichum fioriniae]KAJ0304218.1 hypothetical protein COL516b_006109 [Colletotrichum fioriniae]KAJ0328147.1 hypothetical protein COL5a_005352 [Colletotrichum fioriniae]KAJ3950677.1 nucleolar protein [Colletotrichum fioriniae]
MAPELRKRTRSVTGKEPVAKKAAKVEKVEPAAEKAPKKVTKKATKEEKVEKTPKRKAPEEAQASPVAAKKQKPAKANAKSKKSAAPAPAEPAEEEEKEEKEAEPEATEDAETSVVAFEEEDDDEEVDADIAALAAGLDPEDAPAGDGTVFKSGQDVGKVPKFKKQKQLTNGKKEEPGVVFISRLPHGFYEHELKGYFSQFGNITRLRLARNKKSGASKHYAFLEFAEASTAEIVAKTMDSYLLFGHILKVKTVPADQLHEDVWKGANKRFKKIPWHKIAAGEVAKQRTESDWTHKVSKEEKKRLERAEKLKAIGYEFEAPKLKEAVAPPPEPMAVDAPEETKAIEAAPVEEEKAAEEEEEKVAEVETPKSAKKATPKGGKRRKSRG